MRIFTGRAAVWNDTSSDAGCNLQQNWQHQSSHNFTRLQRLLKGWISSVEKILLQLQLGIQSPRFYRGDEPRVYRTNPDQRHGQQRLLLSLHLPDLLCVFHRIQRSVFQLRQRLDAGVRPVCVHLQSSHISRDSVPAGGDGAPLWVVVQVRVPLNHLRRGGKRRVIVVGRPHEPRLVAGRAEPGRHPADLPALRDAPGHPLPAERLQPGLLVADTLGVQLHRDQPVRVSPAVYQPAPVNAGRLQNRHPHIHRRFCRQCHDFRGQLRNK